MDANGIEKHYILCIPSVRFLWNDELRRYLAVVEMRRQRGKGAVVRYVCNQKRRDT
jgi:hypothetical protein